MHNFGLSKFKQNDTSATYIRHELLPNGNSVVFGIPLDFLTTASVDIDFDHQSDKILAEIVQEAAQNRAYEYRSGGFFDNTTNQRWFTF